VIRAFGLLVASSIAVLLWMVKQAEPAPPGDSRPAMAAVEAIGARGTAAGPRQTTERPVPRLPDVSPGPYEPDDGELEEPIDELDELDEPIDEPIGELTADRDEELGELRESPDPASLEDYVPTAADEAFWQRSLAFLDEFVSAIESNAGSCDRMADALELVLSRNRAFIAEVKALDEQPVRNRWFQKQSETWMVPMASRIMEPIQNCVSSERLVSVLQRYTD
jgi:hypothetical protein